MVFIIARPVHQEVVRYLSLSSFQFCHWAVLVCLEPWTPDTFELLRSDLKADRTSRNDKIGYLFQLLRIGDGKSSSFSSGLNFIPSFTANLLVDQYPLIRFVGTTNLATEEIFKQGIIFEIHDAYTRHPNLRC